MLLIVGVLALATWYIVLPKDHPKSLGKAVGRFMPGKKDHH